MRREEEGECGEVVEGQRVGAFHRESARVLWWDELGEEEEGGQRRFRARGSKAKSLRAGGRDVELCQRLIQG